MLPETSRSTVCLRSSYPTDPGSGSGERPFRVEELQGFFDVVVFLRYLVRFEGLTKMLYRSGPPIRAIHTHTTGRRILKRFRTTEVTTTNSDISGGVPADQSWRSDDDSDTVMAFHAKVYYHSAL